MMLRLKLNRLGQGSGLTLEFKMHSTAVNIYSDLLPQKRPVLSGLSCYNDNFITYLSVDIYFAAFATIIITISILNNWLHHGS
jgi:hypothetical protein